MSVFSSLIDQSEVVNVLQEAVKSAHNKGDLTQGMTHAWLFTGPPGSGRSNAAVAFAAALVCKDGGCSKCVDCMSTITGSHADVELIKTEGLSIKIDEIRELISRASWAPSVAAWRVVVIEDADRLTDSAANALLKVIEEPGLRTVWLLCAPTLTDVSVTIRSRCRHLQLRTPSTLSVEEFLIKNTGVDSKNAAFAARVSQGHIGRARFIATNQGAQSRRREILSLIFSLKDISSCFKAAARLLDIAQEQAESENSERDSKQLQQLQDAYQGTGRGMISGGAKAIKDLEKEQKSSTTRAIRDNIDGALLDIASLYRDILLIQSGSQEILNIDFRQEITELAKASPAKRSIEQIEALLEARANLGRNSAPLSTLESLFCALK